jgi:hypothetical protein
MSFSFAPVLALFFADWACAKIDKTMAAITKKPQMALIGILRVPLIGPPVVDETANSEPLQP